MKIPKFFLLSIFLLIFLILLPTKVMAEKSIPYAPKGLVVGIKKTASVAMELLKVKKNYNVLSMSSVGPDNKTFIFQTGKGKEQKVSDELGKSPDIAFAHPNYFAYGIDLPNDVLFPKQWSLINTGIAKEGGDHAWNYSKGSDQVEIIMLDSGVDDAHEDLQGKIVKMVYCPQPKENGETGDCTEDGVLGKDNVGHGTMVAGILAAATNNRRGVSGSGYNTKIISVKVLDRDTGTGEAVGSISTILKGLSWTQNYVEAHPEKKFIVNMSFATYDESSVDPAFVKPAAYDEIFNQLWGKGVLLIAAAGNCGSSCPSTNGKVLVNPDSYPAQSARVLSVGAIGPDDRHAAYSEYGMNVDLSSPGGVADNGLDECFIDLNTVGSSTKCLVSTWPGDQYAVVRGTSFSAPLVSGVASLVWSRRLDKFPGSATNADIKSLIEGHADSSISDTGRYFLLGKVDALAAVKAASQETAAVISPTVAVTPTPVNISCPSTCQTGLPEKNRGNANCDSQINEGDYQIWKSEFGKTGDVSHHMSDFHCDNSDKNSQVVDLIDFEIWRRNTTSL